MKAEVKSGCSLHHKAKETFRYCTYVSGQAGGPPPPTGALHPHPIRAVTVPTSPLFIPASAGGKLWEEIGVVPPVSNAALVLDYLNAPLPPQCALALGDLGLSGPSHFQSEVSPFESPERRLLKTACIVGLDHRSNVAAVSLLRHCSLAFFFSIKIFSGCSSHSSNC